MLILDENFRRHLEAFASELSYIYITKSSFAKTDNSVKKLTFLTILRNHVFHCAFQIISIQLQLGYFVKK